VAYDKVITVGEAVPVSELLKKPAGQGRQPDPIDHALVELVGIVEQDDTNAYPWDYGTMKPLTARAKALRAIERAGAKDKVHVSARNDRLYFSQTPLRATKKRK
jgi:hypothetical protein